MLQKSIQPLIGLFHNLFYTFHYSIIKTGLQSIFIHDQKSKKEGSNFKSLLTNLSTIAIINFQSSQVLN